MAGLIDTNILLYAANEEAPEYSRSYACITAAGQSPGPWYLTDGILYEFLRVATHPRIFPRPLKPAAALSFLQPLLDSPAFAVLTAGPRHWELLRKEMAAVAHPVGNLFFDIRTVVLMREHGVRTLYTADTDFLQFKGLDIVNPVAP